MAFNNSDSFWQIQRIMDLNKNKKIRLSFPTCCGRDVFGVEPENPEHVALQEWGVNDWRTGAVRA
jgi:hypothetical protein